jgi:hypothetical protein
MPFIPEKMDQQKVNAWAATFEQVYWAGGMPWAVEGGILSPILMPHQQREVPREEVEKILKTSGALLAIWTSHWDCPATEWWWTCCDISNFDLEKIENSRGKRSVKTGLKNCEVKQIEALQFAKEAYPIYLESLQMYGTPASEIPDEEAYRKIIMKKAAYPGTCYWGAYIEEQLVAFSTCFEVNGGVSLGSTKSLKAFQNQNPNAALFFEICRYYLAENRALYVSNGRRNLLHPTSINDFLERMGFRKVYGKLHLLLSPKARLISWSGILFWGKVLFLHKIFSRPWEKLEGFGKLIAIHKSFKNK